MSTQPQTEEYLAARRESCKLLGLNPDDLSPHEAIRADVATVLRLWLDNSQTTLLGGGTADAGKLLGVAEALVKLVPEPEHKSHGVDPRQRMWETYSAMRERGEAFERTQVVPGLQAEIGALRAELAALRGEAPAAPASPAPLPPNVVSLSKGPANNAPTPAPCEPPQPPAKPAWEVWLESGGYGGGYDRWADNR